MKFINLTRRTEIGANSYYLEAGGHRLVLDSGMHPKLAGEEALPNLNALGGRKLDAIIVSHSHQDHIGTLPVLMRRQPQAHVFMTEPTAEIGRTLLHNSVNVMTRQREELGAAVAGAYPLFTHREIDRLSERWRSCALRQTYTVFGERVPAGTADTTFEFFEAGHVLGSTGVMLRTEGRTVFYTGDVNFDDQTIAQAAVFPESEADGRKLDVLIMECTRGDTPAPPGWSRASEESRLMQAIENAFVRGGCVLIPVFALGKTQEILAILYKFRREKTLDFPIYIGGLSSKITEIYDQRAQMGRRQLSRLQLLDELRPFVLNSENIHDAGARSGRVYALSSGMMTAKTLSNIFAQRIVDQPRHSIFFVGYADPESPAGILRSASPNDEVVIDPDQPPQRVRCHIEQFQFSAHASRESLLAFAQRLAPKKIVLVHGDPPAVEWMRARLASSLLGCEVTIPTPGIELEL
ncbi:MAG TPA: MBL fold metallo-hydrolase [Chthoniobacterales bacterium]|nr:MBL fold metallo-hydrolase [Chthoniobacterales bacterium]